jgi:methionyl-tRNA formyltransferase
MKIAFLVSGELGEFVLKHFINKYNLSFVLTDKESKNIVNICNSNNIPFYAGNPRKQAIESFVNELSCDVIVSVNYLFLVDSKVIKLAKKLCFNLHGSLLPKYRGRTPHVWAIINNEIETGITAHIIDEGCDTGDIIKQIKVKIEKEDTGASILEKYKQLYIHLVEQVLYDFNNGTLVCTKQEETKATYFGRRTPDDGRIDWNWSAERIINWVRAQAYPYPGAFTYYNQNKVIIDKISKSDFGFNYNIANGTILSCLPLQVKCCDSVVHIKQIRFNEVEFKINEKFK